MKIKTIKREFTSLVLGVILTGCASPPLKPAITNTEPPSTAAPLPPKADNTENRSQNLRDQAYAEYLKGDLPKAVHFLETSLLLDPQPQESWPRYILYYCYLALGDYSRALSIAESLVKDHPYQSLVYQQVGLANLWLGDAQQAVADFQRALDFESHSPRVHFYLGLAYAQLNQDTAKDKSFQEAKDEYDQILKSNPKDFMANYELASLFLFWDRYVDKVAPLIATTKESITPEADEELPQEKLLYSSFYVPMLEGILACRKGEAKASLKILLNLIPHVPSGIKADLAEIYFFIAKDFVLLSDAKTAKGFFERSISMDPKGAYVPEGQKTMRSIASKEGTPSRSPQSMEIGF
jgi:tetratricopeptide (TPR) repeat protein